MVHIIKFLAVTPKYSTPLLSTKYVAPVPVQVQVPVPKGLLEFTKLFTFLDISLLVAFHISLQIFVLG